MSVELRRESIPVPLRKESQTGSGRTLGSVLALSILFAGAAIPSWVTVLSTRSPETRDIRIEAYRYGFSPSRIYANRGDRLRLTFATRDTGQSFFLQDYDLHVTITPGDRIVSVARLSHPDDSPVPMETVEIVAGLPGWRGWLVSKSQFRNHTYNGPLHGTERGELIVAPNILLYAGLGLLLAIPLAGLTADGRIALNPKRPIDLLLSVPWLKKALRAPSFPSTLALPMLALFWFIILAGLFGTKVSGRNAGPMMVWVLWLSTLIIFLVPLWGRIWCTACPLPLVGEWMQRSRLARNSDEMEGRFRRVLGIPLIWPAWLSGAWPRVLLFLLLGTFSTAIVAVPAATSWMLIALMLMAILTAVFPEQRLFCRHLCPINSYISLYSSTGRLMVRALSTQTCDACQERFCLTGSVKGWGCPYGLCAGEVQRNNDCGLCMECVKTCAYNNVSVFWRKSGPDQTVANWGEAWQAIVMFALACLYSYINLGAWDGIRNWTDIVDKKHWGTFTIYALMVWAACLGLLPLLWYLLTRTGIAAGASPVSWKAQFRATTAALIPIGQACWIAFGIATALSMMTFVLQSLSDPFNWGWSLLGMAGARWHIIWAPAIPWLQVACVLAGAAFALRTLYDCWARDASGRRGAILGSLPLGSFLLAAAGGMIYFFAG